MTALAAILENFDGAAGSRNTSDVRVQQMKAAAYEEGYAAGLAAEAANAQERAELIAAVSASVDAMLKEMQEKLNAELCATLHAILEKTLPALSERGFAAEASSAIMKHVSSGENGPVVVRTGENSAKELSKLFADIEAAHPVSIEADPSLGEGAVTADWAFGGFTFDIEKAVECSLETLKKYAGETIEEASDE